MKKENKTTLLIATITSIITLIGLGVIIRLNVLPTNYLLIFITLVIANLILLIYLGFNKKSKVPEVLLIVMALIMGATVPYTSKLDSALRKITNHNVEKHTVNILVHYDSPYETIQDVIDLPFGANTSIDQEAVNQATQFIKNETDKEPHIQRFNDFTSLNQAFDAGMPEVLLLRSEHMDSLDEIFEGFISKVKVIASYTYEVSLDENLNTNTNKDTFSIYISGLDFAGDISGTQRSDANIVLTINPIKHEILMTSIPRDTFVVRADNGQKDKLSLVGSSGMNNIVKTIENFLEMDIDYTLKVNWTSVIDVVDALGGITVDSPHSFKSHQYYFNKGLNDLDGQKALSFVSNRKNLPEGDDSRAKNQQIVLQAIINKILSPSIITNYHSFLDAISDSIVLNMPSNQLNNLIKAQLNSMSSWDIYSTQVIGEVFDTWDCYSAKGVYQVVKEPDAKLLSQAQRLIEMMENNESIANTLNP